MGLLKELASIDPPTFVFGSVAEAVLLDGALGASHGDLDVLAGRDELDLRVGQFRQLGFEPFSVYYEPRAGLPGVLGSARDQLALELSLFDRDAAGTPFFAVEGEDGMLGISMPDGAFEWPPTTIEGVPVHTLSPLALFQIRAGLIATRAFGSPPAGKHEARQARLVEAFFADTDEASLQRSIVSIAD